MSVAIYPGSFDPITYGHLDIIQRASTIFDKLIVAALINPKKEGLYMFSTRERIELIKNSLDNIKNVEVVGFDGLLVDYMKNNNIKAIVKGIRAFSDYEEEYEMADTNKRLYHKAETLFIPCTPKLSMIRSSKVKMTAQLGGNISDLVPAHVEEAIKNKIR